MRKRFVINFITLLLVLVFGMTVIRSEFFQIIENRKNLKDIEEKTTALNQKSQKIEQLNQELSQNPKNQETILKYIPTERSEDLLINYLDGTFYTEGVAIRDITLQNKNSGNSLFQIIPENSQIALEGDLPLQMSPQPVSLAANFNFSSSYEKIVALLEKMDGLKRFNETTYLKITKNYPENKKEDATLNFLRVEWGLEFNFLKKIISQSEVGGNIFEKENFDNEVLKNIEAKAVNDVNDPNGQTDGRNNPFIP